MKKLSFLLVSALVSMVSYADSTTPSVNNPVDMTSSIVNPNFDGIQFAGWSGTGFGAGGATAECAERFNMTFDTYQIINGLPNGIYKVLVNGLYRAGSYANDWTTKDDATVRHAKLYANSGSTTFSCSLPSLASGATDTISGVAVEGELQVPNSMVQFVTWQDAGYYNNNSVMIAVEDGTLKIGVCKDVLLTNDWTIVDTWRLLYYGTDAQAYKMMYHYVDSVTNFDVEAVRTTGLPHAQAAYQEYKAIQQKAADASTADEFKQYAEGLSATAEELLASVTAYNNLKKEYEAILDNLQNNTIEGLIAYFYDAIKETGSQQELAILYSQLNGLEGADALASISKTPLEVLTEGCYTTNEVNAYTSALINLYRFCATSSISQGQDCTNMLINPDFSNGFTGWTKVGAGTIGNYAGITPPLNANVEVYNNNVDIYQVVKGVQPGIYSVTCSVFERPSANGSYNGSEISKVSLFINDFKTPVLNICNDAISTEEAVDGQNSYLTRLYTTGPGNDLLDYLTDYGYVPNGMLGTAIAFSAGRYRQTVYGIVEEGQDLKIGLSSGGATAHWVMWGDFKITYEGISDEAINTIAETYVANAETYLEINGNKISSPMAEILGEAANDVKYAEDTQAKYDAIIILNKLLNVDTPANATAFAEVEALLDQLGLAIDEYCDVASDEAFEEALTLQDSEYPDLTTEQLQQLAKSIKEAISNLKIPAEAASDDNPVDYTLLIENADVEEGALVAWLYTKNGGNGPVLDQGLNGGRSIEFWNSTAANLKFNVWQTVTLPAGTYELSADAANSFDGQLSNNQSGRAYLYAKVGNKASSVPVEATEARCTEDYKSYSVFFTIPEKAEVTLGFMSVGTMEARWFVCDNFRLTYYGESSSHADTPDEGTVDIQTIHSDHSAIPVAVHSLSGTRLNTLKKGINVVTYSDGTVKKVFVK